MTNDPQPAEVQFAPFVLVCASLGCPTEGRPVVLQAPVGCQVIVCGACGQESAATPTSEE